MGATSHQQVPIGPALQDDQDSQQVRGSSEQTASTAQSGQQSSFVPSHPNLQATQTFFGSGPAPTAAASPAPAVQGCVVGAINTTQPLYCPAQQVWLCMRMQQLTEQVVKPSEPVQTGSN